MKAILLFLLFSAGIVHAQLTVVPGTISGFDQYPDQLDRLHRSFEVIEAVINSEEFRDRVVNYKDRNGKGFSNANGFSNQGVYDFLMTGRELVGGAATPGEINFDLKRHYFGWFFRKKVVAETDPGVNNLIKLSEWFYWDFQVHQIAGNLIHEWVHLMGFYHDNARDRDSVPYAVGEIMAELAKNYLEDGHLRGPSSLNSF